MTVYDAWPMLQKQPQEPQRKGQCGQPFEEIMKVNLGDKAAMIADMVGPKLRG